MNRALTGLKALAVWAALVAIASNAPAQDCGPWQTVAGWQGTFTLVASGSGQVGDVTYTIKDQFTANFNSMKVGLLPAGGPGGCILAWGGDPLLNPSFSDVSVSVNNVEVNPCGSLSFMGNKLLSGSQVDFTIDPSSNTYRVDATVFATVTETVVDTCLKGSSSSVQGYPMGLADPTAPLGVFPLPKAIGILQQTNFSFTAPAQVSYGGPVTWTLSFKLTPSRPWVKVWMSGGKSGQAAVHQSSEIRAK